MDQLRKIAAWLKRYHFWVLSVLIALIALGCWWSAAGTLSAQFKANQSKIQTEFTNLSGLRNKAFHPNEDINKQQEEETGKQAEDVAKIWQQLYERQRENVLEWPEVLGEAFHKHVEKAEFGSDIPPNLRQRYQDYVERHFPKLPQKIGARALREGEMNQYGGMGGGEYGRGPGAFMREGVGPSVLPDDQLEDDENDYICEWLDQGHVRDELNFPQRPSALRIWVTQENVWVYHTLLDVIKKTNDAAGATRMSNAAVPTIYSLVVGQEAANFSRTKDRIYKVATATPAAGTEMMEPGAEPGGEMPSGEMRGESLNFNMNSMRSGFSSEAAMTPEQEQAMLLTYRYLDTEGKPIGGPAGDASAASELDGGGAGIPAPIDMNSFGVEYKRLPVRMVLQMDQRWLPQLVSACASQPLQVEVQEVRINPPDAGGMEGGGFGSGFRGGGGGFGASLFPDRMGIQTFSSQPNLVNVVIQGVIYIFNKPNQDQLKATEEAQLAGVE